MGLRIIIENVEVLLQSEVFFIIKNYRELRNDKVEFRGKKFKTH